jgi:para-aminobenzoate synthetase/4-amino-4-deoxychorismate lyase
LSISSVFKPARGWHNASVPDPRHGVFETLLVIDGHAVELDAHLERLSASLSELFPDRETLDLAEPIQSEARRIARGSVRATVAPRGDALGVEISGRERALGDFMSLSDRKSPSGELALLSVPVPGGLGAYKWADRSLLDEAQASMSAEALPLIVDTDGTALEASRANVFAVRDGALFTPPLDGRILPGITRMRVLEIAAAGGIETTEIELRRDELLAADGVFLTGSVRGIEMVRSIDGTALSGSGEVASELGAELRQTWVAAKVG